MNPTETNNHFKRFAAALEREITRYGDEDEDRFVKQKRQIETLLRYETEFRTELVAHKQGPATYEAFVRLICDEQKNILTARPFFRERQGIFIAEISKALKARDAVALYGFSFNFKFVQFVMRSGGWRPNSKLAKLSRKIIALREEIVQMNMPLVINRARIFYSRTPKSHLTYMDLVQIGCEGLMAAVDKYVPPPGGFTAVFRGVAIGRMTGNFIEEYSETPIHFYPVDKRKLYRANKVIGRHTDGVDFERLAAEVNDGMDGPHRTSSAEIADLMAAASCVSADSSNSLDPEAPEPIQRFAAPESTRPDYQLEQKDSHARLVEAMECLTVWERKVLMLKGVSL